MTDRLQGKVALVTGGSRGIGRGIALRLAQDGCDTVAITYRTDRASADDTAHRLEELGAKAVVLQSTLEEPASIPGLFDALDQELERVAGARGIDILVNVAGLGAQESLESMDQDTYDKIMAINARAPFFVTQAAATRLRDGGRVVNISSVYSRRPTVSNPVYSMAKAALNVLTEVMAAHLGPRGITVNTVARAGRRRRRTRRPGRPRPTTSPGSPRATSRIAWPSPRTSPASWPCWSATTAPG